MLNITSKYDYNNIASQNIASNPRDIAIENKTTSAIDSLKISYNNRDLAARKIQVFFRKFIAAKAYKHMFDNGEYFKQYQEISPKPKSLLDYLQIAQKLSSKAINDIKHELGGLTQQESMFLRKIIQIPKFTLMHQTLYKLDSVNAKQQNVLTIHSHRYLTQYKVTCKNNTSTKDIRALSNNDFIFFNIDFLEKDLYIKPEVLEFSDNTDYGYKAYLTYFKNQQFSYLTLTDHCHNEISDTPERDDFFRKYRKLYENIPKYYGALGKTDVPIFTTKDMRHGLAYYCIYILRKTNCPQLNKFVYEDETLHNINKFFHIIFTPEIHIPRIFSTTDFQVHKLREMNLEEVYKLVLFYNDPDMIRQYCLNKFSDKENLINLDNPLAKETLFEAASVFVDIMKYAIKDTNASILSFCLPWSIKIKDTGCQNGYLFGTTLADYEICSNILQHNKKKLLKSIQRNALNFSLYLNLIDILLNSKDFNSEITLLLKYYMVNKSYPYNLSIVEQVNLLVMSGNLADISETLIQQISYEDISTDFFSDYVCSFEYERFRLNYVQLIAKAITANDYDRKVFADRLKLYAREFMKNHDNLVLEESFLGMLSFPELSKQEQEILQEAFITSGLLVPDKKINNLGITLKEYAKQNYNISL